jgi:hypothetical protein
LEWFFERRPGTRGLHEILIGLEYSSMGSPRRDVPNPCVTYIRPYWPTVDLWADGDHWVFNVAGITFLFVDSPSMLVAIEKARSS